MTQWLRQSTARTLVMGPFLDSTTGADLEIALDITEQEVLLSKNGGAFTLKSETTHGVHDAAHNGWYTILLDTTDTNTLGLLAVAINMAGALPVWAEFMVVEEQVWDSFFGADLLDVNAAQWLGTAVTALNNLSGAQAADAMLDELLAGHVIVGSTGAAISAAGAGGDPWLTPLPGAYVAGTAGYLIGNLAASVWSFATRTLTFIGNLLGLAKSGSSIYGLGLSNLSIVRGTTHTVQVAVVDANGSAVNIAGYTIKWMTSTGLIKSTTLGTVTITSAPGGLFEYTLSDAETLAFPVGDNVQHECKIKSPGGVTTQIYHGAISIGQTLIISVP